MDDLEENEALENKMELIKNKARQPQVIEERLKRLEAKIKVKFQNCFESVRKAFLTLDGDHDGYGSVDCAFPRRDGKGSTGWEEPPRSPGEEPPEPPR